MGTSKKVDILREFELKSEKHEDGLEAACPPIDVIAQKQVVGRLDIPQRCLIGRCSKRFKQLIEIIKLPMDIPYNLDGHPQFQHRLFLTDNFIHLLYQRIDEINIKLEIGDWFEECIIEYLVVYLLHVGTCLGHYYGISEPPILFLEFI